MYKIQNWTFMTNIDISNPEEKNYEKKNSIIPSNLRAEFNKVKELEEAFIFLNKTDIVLNDNFYIIVDSLLKKFKSSEREVFHESILEYLNSLVDALIPVSPLHRSLSSFYQLIFHPILHKTFRKPKKLSDFNIRIDFIRNIILKNMQNLREDEQELNGDDNCVKLYFYKFDSRFKLSEFMTIKSGGVKQVYDKNYRMKSIIMAGGEEVKIPKNLNKEKPNGKQIKKV